MRECTIEDCSRKYLARDYCRLHYDRLRKGLPLEPSNKLAHRPSIIEYGLAKIPLGVDAKDGYAVVDEEFAWLDEYKWFLSDGGYAVRNSRYVRGERRHTVRMHREILDTPDHLETDHINGNRLDNRLVNLRPCTGAENSRNRKKQKGSSKYKGVTWRKSSNKWLAQIRVNKKSIHLGEFDDENEAAESYRKAAKELFGEFARAE